MIVTRGLPSLVVTRGFGVSAAAVWPDQVWPVFGRMMFPPVRQTHVFPAEGEIPSAPSVTEWILQVFGEKAVAAVTEFVQAVLGHSPIKAARADLIFEVSGERGTDMDYIVVNPDAPIEKAVSSNFYVGLEWMKPLVDTGETITTAVCTVSPSGLTLSGLVVISGRITKQMIDDGTPEQLYELLFAIDTSGGQHYNRVLLVRVL